jgi:DNA (cytosine-5)-methyltransferase 1
MWLYVPDLESTESRSARASEASNTDSTSPSEIDTDVWVHANGKPVQRPFSRQLKRRPVLAILSGTISNPSRANDSAITLIRSSAQDSPVSRSLLQDLERGSPTRGGSGPTSTRSFATWDPSTSSWRTSPDSSPTGSMPFAGRWPNAGTMRSGTCTELPTHRRRTTAKGSTFSRGEYPTPAATRYGSSQNEGKVPHKRPTEGTESLDTWARKAWPTATAGDAEQSGSRNSPGSKAKQGVSLTDMVKTGDSKGRWYTPTARDWKDGRDPSPNAPTQRLLGRQVHRTEMAGEEQRTSVCLNPSFVEWLMGLPRGLISCALSETEWSRWQQQQRSLLSWIEDSR